MGGQALQDVTVLMIYNRFPGMLDNSAAGGLPSGMGMYESMEKECMEEASLDAALVKKYARAVGVISYFFRYARG